MGNRHSEGAGMRIGMIWAQARGGVIGADGAMPWHLPEDLKHFRHTTQGSPVVMGRRTWESFPPRFRPLPRRTNIVITRRDDFSADGALRAGSLAEALELARAALGDASTDGTTAPDGSVWVIGGGAVYAEAMELADLLVVTDIDLEVDGDTLAPEIPSAFRLAHTDPKIGWHDSAHGLRYRIRTLVRR